MGRNNFWRTVGIILLVLVLMGVVSVGDIIGVAAKIFMSIIFLLLAIWAIFAYRIHRARRVAEQQGKQYQSGYTRHYQSRRQSRSSSEGDVTLHQTSSPKQSRVNSKVGDYVDYEDVGK
ncbi:MAG: DUF4834 family protein [Tidjanibacter sp.]|nr:DUF4834 family protein [Tidjanibacter sp.]